MLDGFQFPKAKVYLSKRNLLTLLAKLEREEAGEVTACALIKNKGADPTYQQTMDKIMVIAVSDKEYYKDHAPNEVNPADEAIMKAKQDAK